MNPAGYQVRRATVDDLPQLLELWKLEQLPRAELEKRLTEFQVATAADGKIIGAVGLQMAQKQGLLHSEVYFQPDQAEALRTLFWERMQTLGNNHGLVRIWTQEKAPFWHKSIFDPASAELLAKRPATFQSGPGTWFAVQLREEVLVPLSLDQEFALFVESEKERTEQLFQRARTLKWVAAIIAIVFFGLVILGSVYLLRSNPSMIGR